MPATFHNSTHQIRRMAFHKSQPLYQDILSTSPNLRQMLKYKYFGGPWVGLAFLWQVKFVNDALGLLREALVLEVRRVDVCLRHKCLPNNTQAQCHYGEKCNGRWCIWGRYYLAQGQRHKEYVVIA